MDRHFVFVGLLNEDVNDFFDEFNRISRIKRWSVEEQPYALASYLSGAALEFYRYVMSMNDLPYPELVTAIKKEFKPNINYYMLLANANMANYASVWEYVYATINIAYKADKNMREEEIIQFLLRGMVPQLKDKLATQIFRSINDLKDVLRQIEGIYGNVTQVRSFQADVTPLSANEKELPIGQKSGGDNFGFSGSRGMTSRRDFNNTFDEERSYPNTRNRSLQARRGR